jgi:hypothetical protein
MYSETKPFQNIPNGTIACLFRFIFSKSPLSNIRTNPMNQDGTGKRLKLVAL